MSRTPETPRTPLFDHLVDDAAVFPPGLSPLDVAVREHLGLRQGRYAAQLGPLLVPAGDAADLASLASADDRTALSPLTVGLVLRPGTAIEPLLEGVEILRDSSRVRVAAVELGWSSTWHEALDLDVPAVVEVGSGADQATALDDIATAVDGDADVRAKFRTGATPQWPWPDEAALAEFLDATVLRGLSFKLTGGLHHVVRGDDDGEPSHGLLNVIVATHEALHGAESAELAGVLAQTSAERLAERVAAYPADEAQRVRGSFTAYGCCGVLDPLTELEALGLLR